jgi:site-specific DNA recombinase
MLTAANRHEFDAVVAWHSARLHRSPIELEEFIAFCEEHQLQVLADQSGAIDLSTPSGRMVAHMLGSAARYGSEHKSERTRRKHRELAQGPFPRFGVPGHSGRVRGPASVAAC